MIRALLGRLRRAGHGTPPSRARLGLLFGPCPVATPSDAGPVARHPRYRDSFAALAELVQARRGWTPRIGPQDKAASAVHAFERAMMRELLHQLSQLAVLQAEGVEYDWVGAVSIGELAAGAAAGAYAPEDAVVLALAGLEGVLTTAGHGDLVLVAPVPDAGAMRDHEIAMLGARSSVLGVRTEALASFLAHAPAARPLRFHVLPHTGGVALDSLRRSMASLAARPPQLPLYLASVGGRLAGAMDAAAVCRIAGDVAHIGDVFAAIAREESGEVAHLATVIPHDELDAAGLPRLLTTTDVASLVQRRVAARGAVPLDAGVRTDAPGFWRDPYPAFERCRHAGALRGPDGAVFVVGHAEARDILVRGDDFRMPPDDPFPVLHGLDGAEHLRRRRLLAEELSPARQRERTEAMRAHTGRRVEELRARAGFALVEDLALHVPRRVTCEWLGIREPAVPDLLALPSASARWRDVAPHLAADGVLPALHRAGDFTPDEVAQFAPFLLFAGLTTVTDAVVNAVCALHERPALLDEVRTRRVPVSAIIDELLRLEAPIHVVQRVATTDEVIGGCAVRAGTSVRVALGAANRDPRAFDGANRLDPARAPGRPLTFGHGPHYCLGATAGRAFTEILVEAVTCDLVDFAPVEPVPALLARHEPGAMVRRRVPEIAFARVVAS